MSASPGDIVNGIRFVVDVIGKVKENQEELRRLSNRLQHVMISVEESRQRNQLQPAEYEDALTVVAALVERSHLVTQKLLKRSLGNRTWSRGDISSEIKRITADVDTYLNVHVVKTLDFMHSVTSQVTSQVVKVVFIQNCTTLLGIQLEVNLVTAAGKEPGSYHDLCVCGGDHGQGSFSHIRLALCPDSDLQLAEIDIRLRAPDPADGVSAPMPSDLSTVLNMMKSESRLIEDLSPSLHIGQNLASSARISIQVSCLKMPNGQISEHPVTISNVSVGANYTEVLEAIRQAGYVTPADLTGEAMMITVSDIDEFDATTSGGLKISRNTRILTWWSKYCEYHGIAPRTTPRHTLADLAESDLKGHTTAIQAGGVTIRFHRTLRVPDNLDVNPLPVDLGPFPLLPVSMFSNRLPGNISSRGGFFMPIFEREALFISFEASKVRDRPAVKVSAGGVNVLTGSFKNIHAAQVLGHDYIVQGQDYLVPGLQPWIDGVMTEEGVVRQFVAMPLGKNYTVEEQVTGKAEEGGFQFDIFPRRPERVNECFFEFNMQFGTPRERAAGGRKLNLFGTLFGTPANCEVPYGAIIGFFDPRHWPVRSEHNWTVGAYQRRIGKFPLTATYGQHPIGGMLPGYLPQNPNVQTIRAPRPPEKPYIQITGAMVASMGTGLGGRISQKIYKDGLPTRVYDEENGQRFHVHIISAELWETVTGVLPPITPITPDTYKAHNLPWFTLSDSNVASLAPTTDVLENVKTITHIDHEKATAEKAQALTAAEALIDPDHPPSCSIHIKVVADVVFRPCGHTACSGCFGRAMLKRSRCPLCSQEIGRFVGMKEPVAGVDEAGNADDDGNSTPAWNTMLADIELSEALAAQAIRQGKVVVIHLEKDSVGSLHSHGSYSHCFCKTSHVANH
ncbi:hypothetical protein GGX14DRAFT_518352 [Mycena pura]|uniref:RING-type domain-containing protein n=1 Tax=Mycena pura TaxID=153505 RepID=A0AAD6VP24_9AGAR|nr:hypothetical protein GGX14DRAFT_518352 [Mycena pura]